MKLLIWRGVVYKSWEQCKIQTQSDGYHVESLITGSYRGKIFTVNYVLRLDKHWCIQNFEIHPEIDSTGDLIKGIKVGDGTAKEVRAAAGRIRHDDGHGMLGIARSVGCG